jgi:hypothetical protein
MTFLSDADTRLSRLKRQTLVLCVLLAHGEVAEEIDCAMQSRREVKLGVAHGREQTTAVGGCGDGRWPAPVQISAHAIALA